MQVLSAVIGDTPFALWIITFVYSHWHYVSYALWVISLYYAAVKVVSAYHWLFPKEVAAADGFRVHDTESDTHTIKPLPEYADIGNGRHHVTSGVGGEDHANSLSSVVRNIKSHVLFNNIGISTISMIVSIMLPILFVMSIRAVYNDWNYHYADCETNIGRRWNEQHDMWTKWCTAKGAPKDRSQTPECKNAFAVQEVTNLSHNVTSCANAEVLKHIPGWPSAPELTHAWITIIEMIRNGSSQLLFIGVILSFAALIYVIKVPVGFLKQTVQHGQQIRNRFKRSSPSTTTSTSSTTMNTAPSYPLLHDSASPSGISGSNHLLLQTPHLNTSPSLAMSEMFDVPIQMFTPPSSSS